MVWVQLLAVKQIEQAGRTRTYRPGDYVEVGKQTANRWVADGVARYPDRRVASEEAFRLRRDHPWGRGRETA